MRLYEIAGRIVKGVNTTPDVGTDAVKKQAAKFGNKVDRDGKPPLLHKKAYKNTTPNKLANLNIGESFTTMEWAIIEGGHDLNDWRSPWELITPKPKDSLAQKKEQPSIYKTLVNQNSPERILKD